VHPTSFSSLTTPAGLPDMGSEISSFMENQVAATYGDSPFVIIAATGFGQ
jgi:hypothetical protein